MMDLAEWSGGAKQRGVITAPRSWLQRAKIVLPVIALLLLLISFIWPTVLPSFSGISTLLTQVKIEQSGEATMYNLSYQGVNKTGQPFGVTADRATRDMKKAKNEGDISLTTPQADFTTKDGNFVALTAENGVYNEKNNALELTGDVNVYHDNGSTFSAPQLSVDLNQNKAWTDKPVEVHGDFGQINAESGMQVIDGGKKVIFQGRSTARLTGKPQEE